MKTNKIYVIKVLAFTMMLVTSTTLGGCSLLFTDKYHTDEGAGTDADTGTDTGTGNPCDEIATPEKVAQYLGETCSNVFGQAVCNFNEDFTKSTFISALMLSYIPTTQLQGYVNPSAPHFNDVSEVHTAHEDVEKAYWMKLLESEGSLFSPALPASVCWTEPFLDDLQNLSIFYMVVSYVNPTDSLPPDWFWATSMTYTVYGSTPADHFTDMVRVVNNLGGDFTVGQDQDALAEVQLACLDPDGVGTTEYQEVPAVGVSTFNNVDCYDQTGDGFELKVQFKVATLVNGANTGDKIRVAVDPTSLVLRGEGLEVVPTFLIE